MSGVGSLQSSYDNVFVMYHRKNDNKPVITRPAAWKSLQSNGEIATGVGIMGSNRMIIVSPTEMVLPWSSASVNGGGVTTSDRLTALNDWSGRLNTAAQITRPAKAATTFLLSAHIRWHLSGYSLRTRPGIRRGRR